MMVERETIQKGLELAIAAGLSTIGWWFGSAPTEVMIGVGASMGASWLLNLTEASVQQGLQRWLGQEGVLNHDIERVLGEALTQAAREVRQQLRQHHSYHHWQRTSPEKATRLLAEFEYLEKEGSHLIRSWAQDEARRAEIVRLMGNKEDDIAKSIDQQITMLLHTAGERDNQYAYVLHFLRQELAQRWREHFVQRLKHDTPAWRACQRLWQGSLSAALGQVGRDVAQMRVALNRIVARQEKGTDDAPHVQLFMQALLLQLREQLMRELRSIKEDTSQIKADASHIRGDTSQIKGAILRLLDKVEQLLVMVPELAKGLPPSPTETRSWAIVHPYPALPNFTGRWQERALLSEWLAEDTSPPLFVLRALGGFGKSALTWHWLWHEVDEQEWPRVFWWSFYEPNAGIENFLWLLFNYIAPNQPLPSSNDKLLQALASHLNQHPTLIILDGFERQLRAYGGMGAAYNIMSSEIGHQKLSFEDRGKLVQHLLAIPSIADVATRATVMNELPDEIKTNLAYNSVAKTHVFNIVKTCLQYPNGMQKLSDILEFFEGDSIPMQQFKQALNRLLPKGFDGNDDRLLSQGNERDCISPLADRFLRLMTRPRSKCKVLMSTRLRPRSLERHRHLLAGYREQKLTALTPADAVTLFRRQGVQGARHEIEQVGERVGYHPLSLRLLAGTIMEDLRQPGDIRVAQQINLSDDLIQNRHHVLEHAYNSLSARCRRLLSMLACLRGPLEVATLDKLFADEIAEMSLPIIWEWFAEYKHTNRLSYQQSWHLDTDLYHLLRRGLVQRNQTQLDLHPVVRSYVYNRLDNQERETYHAYLRNYFARTQKPLEKVVTLEELTPLIELYHHTVQIRQYDEASQLYINNLSNTIYFQLAACQLEIKLLRALFPDGENKPPRLKSKAAQIWTLNSLAVSYSLNGQPDQAVPLFQLQNLICRKQGDTKNLAIGLGNLASMAQLHIGSLHDAKANLERQITLSRQVRNKKSEIDGRRELGRLLAYLGRWEKSKKLLDSTLRRSDKANNIQLQGMAWAYRAWWALLMIRDVVEMRTWPTAATRLINTALAAAEQALALANERARIEYPIERDFVRAYWLLGATQRVKGNWAVADTHLTKALTRCREINTVDHEANILLELAHLRVTQDKRAEGERLAEEALMITERSGYVLQGADVHLFFAELALEDGKQDEARDHAMQAQALATCDGPLDYTYKVAYEEAGRLLAQLEG